MKLKTVLSCLALTATVGLHGEAAETAGLYGKKLQGLPAVKLEDLLARPQAGQQVRLEGTIERVCQNKGCWLELKQGTKSVHVTFAGYSFFVPKDTASRAAVLEGRVLVKEPKAQDVAHKKAEGAGESVAAKVSIEAVGVEIASH